MYLAFGTLISPGLFGIVFHMKGLMMSASSGLGRFCSAYSIPECCQSGLQLWMLTQGKKFDKSQR